jgi:UDP-N-acetylmuramoyl-tripeptide--D-alanyl-D-alanine ligase
MLELGDRAPAAHAEIAADALALDPVLVGALGDFAVAFAPYASRLGSRLVTASDAEALGAAAASQIPPGAIVLLKASHGVHLERVLPHLLPAREAPCSTTS